MKCIQGARDSPKLMGIYLITHNKSARCETVTTIVAQYFFWLHSNQMKVSEARVLKINERSMYMFFSGRP